MIDFDAIQGFDWDESNGRKNDKHGVSMSEPEQVFFNAPLLISAPAAAPVGRHQDRCQLA